MRILFEEGEQIKFLRAVKIKLNQSLLKIHKKNRDKFTVTYSTLKKYSRGKLVIPSEVADTLTKISSVEWKGFRVKDMLKDGWGRSKAGKRGQKRMYNLYSKKLNEWRMRGYRKSKFGNYSNKKKIYTPRLGENLSEFLGICIGDGTLTKYFLRISLDSNIDAPYVEYVSKLGLRLFGITPSVKKEKGKNVTNVKFHSIRICNFMKYELGLVYGDKIRNRAKIPQKIIKNKKLMISCLRGLVDTDGNVGNGIFFFSKNPILMRQISEFSKRENLFTMYNDFQVGTGDFNKVRDYFRRVGSSNLKNIIRFNKMFMIKREHYIKNKDLLKFYPQFKDYKLPYKLDQGS